MNFVPDSARRAFFGAAMLAVGALIAGCSGGSSSTTPAIPQINSGPAALGERELARVTVNPADHVVATDVRIHAMGPEGRPLLNQRTYALRPSNAACPTGSPCVQYHGGPTLNNTGSINVFVNPTQTGSGFPNTCTVSNCPPAQWGFPGGFIGRVSNSSMNAEMNQYTGASRANRYPYVGYITMTDPTITPDSSPSTLDGTAVSDATITAELSAASTAVGLTGYHYMYQLYYKKNQALCSASVGACYKHTPFMFCAFHGSQNIGENHIIFSVEPWQDISGCRRGNTTIQDLTSNTLSHELFEAISDPDLNAWFRTADGQEIGDICGNDLAHIILNPNALDYRIQHEWNNGTMACDFGP